ncbi:MAG TPA: haloacid dehalogenase-like hydrolase [Bacteroidota bacterium]|nr:haloacid dehalogenase-like hydrolase [Bacteroidota bacterium]
MHCRITALFPVAVLAGALMLPATAACGADTLRSWNIGPTKLAVIQFVRDVTTEGGPDYVPPEGRIAVFSHDGTLCPELPAPAEIAFLMDRVRALAPKHPRWKSREPFRSALAKNMNGLAAADTRGIMELEGATTGGLTTDEYEETVLRWLEKGRNPRLARPYVQCGLLPMQELLDFLRASGFTIYIIVRGDEAFLRAWAEKAYGVPPAQVIGSSVRTRYALRKGKSSLTRRTDYDLMDDGPGRPQAVFRAIGRRPIAAFGNADADREMLEWVASGEGKHLALLVHHTNGGNEFAYDRHGTFGRLDKTLDLARKSGWTIADMTKDWNRFFAKTK